MTPERREELVEDTGDRLWGKPGIIHEVERKILRDLIATVEQEAGQAGYTQGQEDLENQHKNLLALERIEGRKEARWVTCPTCRTSAVPGQVAHDADGNPELWSDCPTCFGELTISRELAEVLELAEHFEELGGHFAEDYDQPDAHGEARRCHRFANRARAWALAREEPRRKERE